MTVRTGVGMGASPSTSLSPARRIGSDQGAPGGPFVHPRARQSTWMGPADLVPVVPSSADPYLINPFPVPGDPLADMRQDARYMPIQFDVMNSAGKWSIWIKFKNWDGGMVVYDSVIGFLPSFDSRYSTWNGTTMTVMQQSGWQDDIEGIWLGGQADAAIVPVRWGGPGSVKPPLAP